MQKTSAAHPQFYSREESSNFDNSGINLIYIYDYIKIHFSSSLSYFTVKTIYCRDHSRKDILNGCLQSNTTLTLKGYHGKLFIFRANLAHKL